MNKDFGGSIKQGSVPAYIKGLLIGIAVTALMTVIFSAIMLALNTDRAYAAFFATLSVAIGSFVSAFITAKKLGCKGYIVGLIVAAVYFFGILIISLIISYDGLSINTVFHLVIILLSSVIGGISGVNKGGAKRYI